MKKILAVSVLLVSLTGCGGFVSKGNNVERKTVDGVECVVGTSQAGSIAVDCNWESK